MAQGGMLNGNDFGSVLFPKAALALSEVRKNNIANDAASTQLAQQKAQMGDISRTFGGLDPSTGIYWNSGRGDANSGLPGSASSIMSNPLVGMMGRLDPKAVLSGISSQLFAAPRNFVRTDKATGETKTVLATPLQALNDQGATYAETGPVDRKIKIGDIEGSLDTLSTLGGGTSMGTGSGAPPVSRGQSSSFVGGSGAGSSVGGPAGMPTLAGAFTNALRTANMTPGARAYETAAGTGAGEAATAFQKAANTAAGTASVNNQFETVTVPDPNNPTQTRTVLKSDLPRLYGAQGQPAGMDALGVPNGLATGAMPNITPSAPPVGVPGGPSPLGSREAQAAKDEAALAAHMNELDMIDKAARQVEVAPGLPSILGKHSLTNSLAVPGGHAADALKLLDFLKNRAILTTFQSARDMSTTGGGVGRLTETELPIFANSQGQFDTHQSEEQFRNQLKDLRSNVTAMKQNIQSGFKKEYGRDLQYAQPTPTNQAGTPNAQAIVDELRRRGVVK